MPRKRAGRKRLIRLLVYRATQQALREARQPPGTSATISRPPRPPTSSAQSVSQPAPKVEPPVPQDSAITTSSAPVPLPAIHPAAVPESWVTRPRVREDFLDWVLQSHIPSTTNLQAYCLSQHKGDTRRKAAKLDLLFNPPMAVNSDQNTLVVRLSPREEREMEAIEV